MQGKCEGKVQASSRNLGSDNSGNPAFNVAHVDALFNEHVAILSPSGSPRIAQDPVIDASLWGAVTDQSDGVVHSRQIHLVQGVVRDDGASRVRVDSITNNNIDSIITDQQRKQF